MNKAVALILVISLTFSLFSLIVYSTETDFSDKTLFFLLTVLRYSSLLTGICSVFLLITNVNSFIHSPSVARFLLFFLFFLGFLYSAGIVIFNAFIISISGGNL